MGQTKITERTATALSQARKEQTSLPVIVLYGSLDARSRANERAASRGFSRSRHHFSMLPISSTQATASELDHLSAMDEVTEIWLDAEVRTTLSTCLGRIGVPAAWNQWPNKGNGQTICIVDSGLDLAHPDFADRVINSKDFTGLASVQDQNGHGTHVASIAAGSGTASQGTYSGVAPQANLMIARVFEANGIGRTSDVMAAIEWAVLNGADILNLSLGDPQESDGTDPLSVMCNAAVDAGKDVVVSAGNFGPSNSSVGSPGAAEKAITVGACSTTDSLAFFSARGPTQDGRTKPDIVAPGVSVIAARAAGCQHGAEYDQHYTSASGTSMAAPFVSGLCALLRSATPGLTPAEIKQIIMATAQTLDLPSEQQGSGLINAVEALMMATNRQDESAPFRVFMPSVMRDIPQRDLPKKP